MKNVINFAINNKRVTTLKNIHFYTLVFFIFNLSSSYSANFATVTWKGTYYEAIPNRPGVDKEYCKQHTPGGFVHVVNQALTQPITTDNGIILDQAKFAIKKLNGVYLINGSFRSRGRMNNQKWEERIHYYLYKLTEFGLTQGVWSSKACKGLYRGKVVNKS